MGKSALLTLKTAQTILTQLRRSGEAKDGSDGHDMSSPVLEHGGKEGFGKCKLRKDVDFECTACGSSE